MNILLTNDDGIHAEGIYAIYRELKKFARVTVCAPDMERSSVGHGITLSHPIFYKKIKRNSQFFGYGVSGMPADCVKFGVSVICKKKPDLIVSGINHGDNDGCSVFYSGTVAGAREGALMGIPAMAVSLASFVEADFGIAARAGARIAKAIIKNGLPKGTFLNVNVPYLPAKEMKGFIVTRQGTEPIHGKFHKRSDPNGREYYWMTGKMPTRNKDLSKDTYALHQGYVTITPIQCDLTDTATLDDMQTWKI